MKGKSIGSTHISTAIHRRLSQRSKKSLKVWWNSYLSVLSIASRQIRWQISNRGIVSDMIWRNPVTSTGPSKLSIVNDSQFPSCIISSNNAIELHCSSKVLEENCCIVYLHSPMLFAEAKVSNKRRYFFSKLTSFFKATIGEIEQVIAKRRSAVPVTSGYSLMQHFWSLILDRMGHQYSLPWGDKPFLQHIFSVA